MKLRARERLRCVSSVQCRPRCPRCLRHAFAEPLAPSLAAEQASRRLDISAVRSARADHEQCVRRALSSTWAELWKYRFMLRDLARLTCSQSLVQRPHTICSRARVGPSRCAIGVQSKGLLRGRQTPGQRCGYHAKDGGEPRWVNGESSVLAPRQDAEMRKLCSCVNRPLQCETHTPCM